MGKLVNDINSAICSIDSCIASAGAKVVKSATYGREAKKSKYLSKLSHLDLIKSRLSRYKDTFLTDNCWPTVCNVDPCLQKVSLILFLITDLGFINGITVLIVCLLYQAT